MKKNFYLLAFVMLSGMFIMLSCDPETDEDDFAIPTSEWGKLTLTLNETGGPNNEWYFASIGSSGMAALTGVDDFSFTYSRTGTNKSTIKFQVSGEDRFDMTWTAVNSGTFEQSFNGTAGNPGSFNIVRD